MKGLARQLSSGLILGLGAVIYAISYAALMFSGALSPYVAYGLTVTLITAAAGGLYGLFAEESTFVSGPDSNTSSVLAGMMAALAATPLPGTPPLHAALAVLMAASVSTALTFLLIERFGVARLVRFVPFQVMAGFLASTGWLMSSGALNIIAGTPLSLDTVAALADQPWRPELAARIVLMLLLNVLNQRFGAAVAIPGIRDRGLGHRQPGGATGLPATGVLPSRPLVLALRSSVAGVATGLAWTPVGATFSSSRQPRVPGSGKLMLTGQLGDVMKESAQAALTLVKSHASGLRIEPASFEGMDLHVHIPAGAIPKDGPSAGVAMFIALASLFTDRPVRHDVAMTGEISLRGLVLPVGGIKEKMLAAQRAGLRCVLLPARNMKDLREVPDSARAGMEFIALETVDDAIRAALADPAADSVT